MSEISIPTGELLWRTRGRHWEYCFVMTPNLDRHSWWRFYREVKAELSVSAEGDQVTGLLKDRSDQKHLYIASIFLDSKLVDQAGRATEQFIVWFPEDQSFPTEAVSVNLAQAVSKHFEATISSDDMSQLTDADETSPETVFQRATQDSPDVTIQMKASTSTPPRAIDIYHQPDGDLVVVAPKKKNTLPKIILLIFAALIGGLVMMYFGRDYIK